MDVRYQKMINLRSGPPVSSEKQSMKVKNSITASWLKAIFLATRNHIFHFFSVARKYVSLKF